MTPDLPRTYTVKEVAAMAHLDPSTIRDRLRTGIYEAKRTGKAWVFTYEQAMAVLDTPIPTSTTATDAWGRRSRRTAA